MRTELKCRHCGSPDIRPSYPRLLDQVLGLMALRPYRCRRCQRRFYERGTAPRKKRGDLSA